MVDRVERRHRRGRRPRRPRWPLPRPASQGQVAHDLVDHVAAPVVVVDEPAEHARRRCGSARRAAPGPPARASSAYARGPGGRAGRSVRVRSSRSSADVEHRPWRGRRRPAGRRSTPAPTTRRPRRGRRSTAWCRRRAGTPTAPTRGDPGADGGRGDAARSACASAATMPAANSPSACWSRVSPSPGAASAGSGRPGAHSHITPPPRASTEQLAERRAVGAEHLDRLVHVVGQQEPDDRVDLPARLDLVDHARRPRRPGRSRRADTSGPGSGRAR